MDQSIAWYQEEQEGQAKEVWSNIWEEELKYQQILQQQQQQQQQTTNNGNSDVKPNDSTTTNNNITNNNNNNSFPNEKTFNPTRRKATNDNKASTYNMNKYSMRLVGKFGGCPWRPPNFQYSRGIIG